MSLALINKDQEVYVIECGNGYTTIGFSYAQKIINAIEKWLGKSFRGRNDGIGTKAHYCRYREALSAGYRHFSETGAHCNAELTLQLIGLEGRRVEVVDRYGERRRFWVGKSTGWMPCHLEMTRINSSGGPAVSGAPFRSVTIIR